MAPTNGTGGGSDRGPEAVRLVLRWLDDIDPRSAVPIYDQIATRLKAAVGGGVLGPGDPLPSVRQLAAELRINPATVIQSYRLLESEGFAEMRQGAGTFIKRAPAEDRERDRLARARRLMRRLLADAAREGLTTRDLERVWNDLFKERTT